jgi:integrase/recombinase XerD
VRSHSAQPLHGRSSEESIFGYSVGLRVSELVGLRMENLTFSPHPSHPCVYVLGKGTPGTRTALMARDSNGTTCMAHAPSAGPRDRALSQLSRLCTHAVRFPIHLGQTCQGRGKAMPEPAVEARLAALPSAFVRSFDPQSTGDIREVALWLRHASTQTTEMYLRAETTTLLHVMNETPPPAPRKGRFRPPDQLIALLIADR